MVHLVVVEELLILNRLSQDGGLLSDMVNFLKENLWNHPTILLVSVAVVILLDIIVDIGMGMGMDMDMGMGNKNMVKDLAVVMEMEVELVIYNIEGMIIMWTGIWQHMILQEDQILIQEQEDQLSISMTVVVATIQKENFVPPTIHLIITGADHLHYNLRTLVHILIRIHLHVPST